MNLPNKITIIRVIAVPFFVVLFNLNYAFPAAILFCIASATDALDGYIARKRGLVTNFGKIMDPLADKIYSTGSKWKDSGLDDHSDSCTGIYSCRA